jgi:hypothetical protein
MTATDIPALTGSAAKVLLAFIFRRDSMTANDLQLFTSVDRQTLYHALGELKNDLTEQVGPHGRKYWQPKEELLRDYPVEFVNQIFPGIEICTEFSPVRLPVMHPRKKIPIPQSIRMTVFARDDYTCLHCGSKERLSVDHIYPESLGGLTE